MAVFGAAEIVDMAVELERVGFKFYNALAEKATNEETRAMFRWLATEEQNHEREFGELRKSVGTYTPPESYPGEWQVYVQALIESLTILGDEEIQNLATKADFVEALKVGIALEKDSIIFYEALKNYVPERERQIVDGIIAQERTHFYRLTGVLKELQR